ncbi:MAG: hypothetical protein IPN76_14010 [Saprospiraceae bacterium]|nr:hypothetical protein [Saprospiraceae bacterium]
MPPISLCYGEYVECTGQIFTSGTPPGGTPVTLQSWLGCDSVVVCTVNELPPTVTDLGQVTLCAPNVFTVCGVQYAFSDPFLYHVCEGGDWLGCDSTVLVDLAILSPQVHIQDPPIIGCGPTSEFVLDASNSEFSFVPGGTVSMLWTGPGILGQANGPSITINAVGEYCFTITASRNNVSCTDTKCVNIFNSTTGGTPTVSNISTQCDASNQFYTITFTINGGDAASYSVTPLNGTLNGSSFTSNPIPTGSGYSFVVTDINGCAPVTVAQNIVLCNCDTEAGTMGAATMVDCGLGTVTATYDNTGTFLDGNDVQVFYLHEGSGLSLANPIASSSTPPSPSSPA